MTIAEVLQLVDRLVEKQVGRHLNDLEKAVVQGLWQGQTYTQIAEECGYDKNYIGDVSRLLFKQLSEQLDEKVGKSNFCWTIERVINSQFVGLVNSNIHWCTPHPPPSTNPSIADEEETNKKNHRDLAIAPSIAHFCDRTTELQTLSHWIFSENTRLISVLGLSGIGKTTLVKQFVDLNLEAFDAIAWKSLKFSRSLDTAIADILTAINCENILIADNPFTQLFNLLSQQKCLLILDDVEELFIPGELTGQYKSEFKDYKTLFGRLREIEHQSCVILISQEQCQEMLYVNDDLSPVKSLQLQGLNATGFFPPLGLSDEKSWSRLMAAYEGHPLYLKDVASLINNVFGGKVSEFLAEDGLILPADTQAHLREMLKRLSPIEERIIVKLSESDRPLSREELRQGLDLSLMELINGLQSLNRRYLLQIIDRETVVFDVSGVVRQYFRTSDDK